jgi:hypothetical protein
VFYSVMKVETRVERERTATALGSSTDWLRAAGRQPNTPPSPRGYRAPSLALYDNSSQSSTSVILTCSICRLMGQQGSTPSLEGDISLFFRSFNSNSWVYQNLAMELIFLCRFFVQANEESFSSSPRLRG